ncbi:hypothetical protein P8625_04670 [Tenacibaculum tangerinum]|uniref:Uncharacterized protein n=1 Tax=Tenacibaculum tangerinum TaxID=3038772 RepID=A0ABY8L7T9_9FLAO|nr:hypothetical protein [Tenacibaculum tangerinum]WGH76458.1 hypothetical protein P8625_04670 [Tenacibaculum tangerinum]
MKHLKTLVVTKSSAVPKILNWQVSTVVTIETAIEKLYEQTYSVVAISKETNEIDKNKLQKIGTLLFPDVTIVEFANESKLSESVKNGYWSKHKPLLQRSYLDNSFEIELANSL